MVEVQACACEPSRTRSATYTPIGKPMNSPITGIAKNPMMPPMLPMAVLVHDTPATRIRRPGITNFTTWLSASSAVAATSTTQPLALLSNNDQISTPSQDSHSPGSTGTTTPISPTAMMTAMNTSPSGSTVDILSGRSGGGRDRWSADLQPAALDEPGQELTGAWLGRVFEIGRASCRGRVEMW